MVTQQHQLTSHGQSTGTLSTRSHTPSVSGSICDEFRLCRVVRPPLDRYMMPETLPMPSLCKAQEKRAAIWWSQPLLALRSLSV